MNAQRGISAITLIASIVVLAVLALIAIPAWRHHQASGHIVDALKATDAAKLVVMESATVHGGLAHIKGSELDYRQAAAISPYVARVTIAADGSISLTTRNTGTTPDPVLLLKPSEGSADNNATPIRWSCNLVAGDPDLVPTNCRTSSPAAAASNAPVRAAGVSTAHSS